MNLFSRVSGPGVTKEYYMQRVTICNLYNANPNNLQNFHSEIPAKNYQKLHLQSSLYPLNGPEFNDPCWFSANFSEILKGKGVQGWSSLSHRINGTGVYRLYTWMSRWKLVNWLVHGL